MYIYTYIHAYTYVYIYAKMMFYRRYVNKNYQYELLDCT